MGKSELPEEAQEKVQKEEGHRGAGSSGLWRVVLLSLCYAAGMAAIFTGLSISSLTAVHLGAGENRALFPFGLLKVTSCLVALTCSSYFQRRAGFLCGVLAGTVGALCCGFAVAFGADDRGPYGWPFAVLCVGHMLIGVCDVGTQFLRFLAGRLVTPDQVPQAISLTLAGGVLACVLGPEMAKHTAPEEVNGEPYALSFFGVVVLYLIFATIIGTLNLDPPAAQATVESKRESSAGASAAAFGAEAASRRERISALGGRVLRLLRSRFSISMLVGATAFCTMLSIMNATPLVLVGAGFSLSDSSTVIQAHILGMFVPGFFSGKLIRRAGLAVGVLGGLGANLLSAIILWITAQDLTPSSSFGYAICLAALTLLGVGWNLAFVAATVWLPQTYPAKEAALAQGTNDCVVHLSSGITILLTGVLVHAFGWECLLVINASVLVLVMSIAAPFLIQCGGSASTLAAPGNNPPPQPVGGCAEQDPDTEATV